MPTITYDMYGTRRLNEVVIAGTHDAGIYKGGDAAKTQEVKVGEQAERGVRIFDLRISAVPTGKNRVSGDVKLKTYHGAMHGAYGGNRTIANSALAGKRTVSVFNPAAGTVMGQGLQSILQDARGFVTNNPTESLLLKFDKCENWGVIAEVCAEQLGGTMYTGPGNLNNQTLNALAGRVIVLFSGKGYAEANAHATARGLPTPMSGIYQFKNLAGAGGGYDPFFQGLQYYGKGGTSVTGTERNKSKIKENIKKQSALLNAAITLGAQDIGNAQVVRMVYWTTTGSVWSIQKRDKEMWKGRNIDKFYDLWSSGLQDYYDNVGNLPAAPNAAMAGLQLKMRLPNIVMMDFATDLKCRIVRDLNTIDAATMATLATLRQGLADRATAAKALLR